MSALVIQNSSYKLITLPVLVSSSINEHGVSMHAQWEVVFQVLATA